MPSWFVKLVLAIAPFKETLRMRLNVEYHQCHKWDVLGVLTGISVTEDVILMYGCGDATQVSITNHGPLLS